MATTTVVLVAATVVSAAVSIYTSSQSSSSASEARRDQRAMYGQETARLERERVEETARLEQAKQEEKERQAAEEERLKPWREAQTSALEKYRQMAENPELSELTQLRLEEEEKSINKELAAKGMLFSGPAAELKQKARMRIIAEETENAKRMLETVMGATPPGPGLMPGTAQYDALIASLQPKSLGQMSLGQTGAEARAQGLYGATSSLIAGATGYYKGQAYEEALKKTQGLFTTQQPSYPLTGVGYPPTETSASDYYGLI